MLEGLEISVLNKSVALLENETQRIDSEYFKKEYLFKIQELKANKYKNLFQVGLIKGGKRLPLGEDFSESGIPYIRAQDVKNNFVEFENSPKISEKLHLELINYQTNYDDVLITNVGNSIGDTGIVKFEIEKCNLTENAVKFISQKIQPDFVFSFFQSKFGKFQIERETVGTAQPKLAIERIRKFIVPLVDNKLQERIGELIQKAYEYKNNSKRKYFDAETCLLSEIGLKDFEPSREPVNIKNFKESFGITKRLDAEYYQPKYEEIENKVKKNGFYTISEVFDLLSNPSPSIYTETGTKVLKTKNIRIPTIEIEKLTDHTNEPRILIKKGDLLFASMGVGSLGRLSYIDKEYENCTTDGTLRIFRTKANFKNKNIEIPCLLFLTSKYGQELIYKYIIGSTGIISISKENVENLIFPKIPVTTANVLSNLVLESIHLKVESERLLEIAKKAVEIAIEIDEATAMEYINDNTI